MAKARAMVVVVDGRDDVGTGVDEQESGERKRGDVEGGGGGGWDARSSRAGEAAAAGSGKRRRVGDKRVSWARQNESYGLGGKGAAV